MIALPFAAGQNYAVVGLGKSGLASVAALRAGGAKVLAWDDTPAARDKVKELPSADPAQADYRDLQGLVLAPGIPLTHPKPHPAVLKARAAGVPILGDIELLWRAQRAALYAGITGTNGKSTTTALLGHIVASAGLACEVGGNLGTPVLTFRPLGAGEVYVLEVSSYQLDLLQETTFDVAILLNITPDHLDRHGGMEGYIAAKKRIFRHQRPPQTAIVGIDDTPGRAIFHELKAAGARVWPLSVEGPAPGGLYVERGHLIDDTQGKAEKLLALDKLERLPGQHNWQNIAAAYGAARVLGIASKAVLAALPTFPGLVHRQEFLGEIDGVRFVNDSKATNADATAKALVCYAHIYWILGGRPKDTGLDGLETLLGRVTRAFLIGEATEAFAKKLEGLVPYQRCGDLATATKAAFLAAKADGLAGAVVLLSPACASFDQYPNFEVRGEAFCRHVAELREGA